MKSIDKRLSEPDDLCRGPEPERAKRLRERFEDIDKLFDKYAAKNKRELDNALIKPIHDKFLYAQNGICAMIAPMGSGKTYNYMKIMAKQEVIFDEPFYELIVICSTSNKFDKTVEAFKPIIKKSKIVAIKDEDLLLWLNKYIRRILKYNSINEYLDSKGKTANEEFKRLINKYKLNKPDKIMRYIVNKLSKYQWKTYPHRCLLILDDFASHPLLRSKETDLSRLLKKLRHFNINVIICVQTVKSIPKDIKRTLSDIVLFPGIAHDDFIELFKESSASIFDGDNLWNTYKNIKDQHATFTIYIKARKVILTQKT